ncbi:hypothetical protein KP77_28000 [Jeotgalibacillus alimentarius]|uniref:SLH domain-containing protein n=1 Tax=Jeotgalibacillus alimentarius TaxID=135826 RepID=A0A0C2VRP9_9BACL|nr:S-layer homology domain-containing protein [Jeotgalibacillus alimentarius]KIL46673.1 hypothetical protein KP77_28000 [Jeotgalibacillus alimentarius]
MKSAVAEANKLYENLDCTSNTHSDTTIFTDVTNHWAKDYINSLAESQIITGKPDGTFTPEEKITRAQFTTMISRLLNLKPVYTIYFQDVYGSLQYEISAAYEAGIIRGISPETFAPHRAITREQMAVILHRAYNIIHLTNYQTFITAPYKDHRQIHFKKEVNAMYEIEIMTGNAEGEFRPKQTAIRAQAAKVIWELGCWEDNRLFNKHHGNMGGSEDAIGFK